MTSHLGSMWITHRSFISKAIGHGRVTESWIGIGCNCTDVPFGNITENDVLHWIVNIVHINKCRLLHTHNISSLTDSLVSQNKAQVIQFPQTRILF